MNLLGNQLIIDGITVPETAIIGEAGYRRTLLAKPQVGRTSTGHTSYKQVSSGVPIHSFKFDIVLSEQDGQQLVSRVQAQMLRLRNENISQFVILQDRRLAIPESMIPSHYNRVSLLPATGWVWADWQIIFTSVSYTIYGPAKLRLQLTAVQSLTQ